MELTQSMTDTELTTAINTLVEELVEEGVFKRCEAGVITTSLERQQWLERAAEAMRTKFADASYTVPQKIRVSIGWPKRAGSCGARVGECWSDEASSDKHYEIFISPKLTDGLGILHVLAHEFTHPTVGFNAGHGKLFKRCALAIGLQGPMRATTAGPEFVAWADALFKRIGPYPAGYLTDSKKQSTRGLRCECSGCGYLARVAGKWLLQPGPPICPGCNISMTIKQRSTNE